MSATEIISAFSARGIAVSLNGAGGLSVTPASLLTDEDRQAIRDHKAELLALLQSKPEAVEEFALTPPAAPAPTAGAQLGTWARPRIIRGTRIPWDCPWHTCNGWLVGSNPVRCSTCDTWFELKPPDGLYD